MPRLLGGPELIGHHSVQVESEESKEKSLGGAVWGWGWVRVRVRVRGAVEVGTCFALT